MFSTFAQLRIQCNRYCWKPKVSSTFWVQTDSPSALGRGWKTGILGDGSFILLPSQLGTGLSMTYLLTLCMVEHISILSIFMINAYILLSNKNVYCLFSFSLLLWFSMIALLEMEVVSTSHVRGLWWIGLWLQNISFCWLSWIWSWDPTSLTWKAQTFCFQIIYCKSG